VATNIIKPTQRKKRSKIVRILLLPILAPIFLIGWSLYHIGESTHKQKPKPKNKTSATPENIELMAIPEQEELIATTKS
jgi:hypothetical protein